MPNESIHSIIDLLLDVVNVWSFGWPNISLSLGLLLPLGIGFRYLVESRYLNKDWPSMGLSHLESSCCQLNLLFLFIVSSATLHPDMRLYCSSQFFWVSCQLLRVEQLEEWIPQQEMPMPFLVWYKGDYEFDRVFHHRSLFDG